MKSEITYNCATTDVADQVDRSYQQAEHRVAVDVTNKYKVCGVFGGSVPLASTLHCRARERSACEARGGAGWDWGRLCAARGFALPVQQP